MDTRTLCLYALAAAQAYFLGAIPFGFLLVKAIKGIDVRTVGSGNIGATNVGRAAGVKIGMLALALDVAKGFIAVTWIPFAMFVLANGHYQFKGILDLLKQSLVGPGFADLRIVCGLAAIVGHIWPAFLNFRGGKGVATAMGALLGLAPWPTLVALFIWSITTRVSGYVSLGSIVAAVALPVTLTILEWKDLSTKRHLVALTVTVAALVILRHRSNIQRLIAGTEHRTDFRRRKPR